MDSPTKLPEHSLSVGLINRLAENLIADNHHSVGCNDEFIVVHNSTIGIGLLPSNVKSDLRNGQIVRITLVYILQHSDFER